MSELKLSSKEYGILPSIINSDTTIEPGLNYVYVTNGRYIIYYKWYGEFKVVAKKVDSNAGRIRKNAWRAGSGNSYKVKRRKLSSYGNRE